MKKQEIGASWRALVLGLCGLIVVAGIRQSAKVPQDSKVWSILENALEVDAGSHLTRHSLVFFPRLHHATRQTFFIWPLSRWKTPGIEPEGWVEVGGSLWVAEEVGEEALHSQDSELGRVPRDDLLALTQDVLRQKAGLEGWVAGGELMTRRGDDPRFLASQSEEVPAGYLSVDIYYDYWSSANPEGWYEGICGFPGVLTPCGDESESTVNSLVGRLVCDLADPWCEAVAWATMALPASLQGLEWTEEIHGPALACPEDLLAEIGWRCDLTRIPEEEQPGGSAESEPVPIL